jgi:ATP-dependent helicase HrpB
LLTREEKVAWIGGRVETASVLLLGSLEIEKKQLENVDSDTVRLCLLDGIRETGIHCLGWQKKSRELQARMQSAHIWAPETWPDVSDSSLINNLSWLHVPGDM